MALPVNLIAIFLSTSVGSLLVLVVALLKVLLPVKAWQPLFSRMADRVMWGWATTNQKAFELTNPGLRWEIDGGEGLNRNSWYLVICNHLSWADIVVLASVLRNRAPMPKFFLKQELLYVPFLGVACWALDMPFMKRYSRSYLLKNPEKRGEDLKTTRKSCEKFRHNPTTVVNYVEGTRFTSDKHLKTKSPYQHLLPPKSGGIAYTLDVMGEQFDQIVDVTIAYPDNTVTPFMDMLTGKMGRIVVSIRTLPVDEQVRGDYFNDKQYKRRFQLWLNDVWAAKDNLLASLLNRV
ncbi:acyltransferase [Parasalinivibrio latis]|uniref:acyltransferase n=1 Tax=Parasalinivibrio latis TaxID=2952610 RepID=UPI003DA31C27